MKGPSPACSLQILGERVGHSQDFEVVGAGRVLEGPRVCHHHPPSEESSKNQSELN